ncbi:hypothetical protein BJ875DRAFT_521211 [Amylocarpus encephaloides]|uniref:Uncharacterized protein n=1 Tax=Amylocarpus encephaloides TaxID=45428 RepID=A0A9P8C2B8_9HELO|nr:hypothetical protein BJ875DRAFT_521211 [Amylocarpus encephaloides]
MPRDFMNMDSVQPPSSQTTWRLQGLLWGQISAAGPGEMRSSAKLSEERRPSQTPRVLGSEATVITSDVLILRNHHVKRPKVLGTFLLFRTQKFSNSTRCCGFLDKILCELQQSPNRSSCLDGNEGEKESNKFSVEQAGSEYEGRQTKVDDDISRVLDEGHPKIPAADKTKLDRRLVLGDLGITGKGALGRMWILVNGHVRGEHTVLKSLAINDEKDAKNIHERDGEILKDLRGGA